MEGKRSHASYSIWNIKGPATKKLIAVDKAKVPISGAIGSLAKNDSPNRLQFLIAQ